MSSPSKAPALFPHRKIAPLPLRYRSSSGQPPRSQNLLNPTPSLSPGSSAGTGQLSPSVSDASIRRHSYHHSDSEVGAGRLSPPAVDPPRAAPHLDQTDNQPGTFEFRNVTPQPSPQPEEKVLSSSQDSQTGLSNSIFPILSTTEQGCPQPLHISYSDEISVISGANDPSNSAKTSIAKLSSDSTPGGSVTPFSPSIDTLSFAQTSGLSPSPSINSRRISDTSIVSEDNDAPVPYDVREEKAPLEPFFAPTFQAALQSGLEIPKSIVAAIERLTRSSELRDDLKRLLDDAKHLSTFYSSDTRTIAVLGDSGEGKSSLINALLHYPEVAKTGDIGAACTSVVTEYRQRTKDHTAAITIEVEYLSSAGITELIKELVWNYRQLLLPDIEEDKVDAKDYARYQRESEQAWSALEAAFRHQELFRKEMLSDMSEGALERVTDQLIRWGQDLDWPEGGNSGMWKSTAEDAEECCEKTSVFMQDRFWPFTKIIRVYLDAQVLETGVVLADLPGLQDTNLARVRATQAYLMMCDHVFIVAKISRAITDQSLKSSLYTVLVRHAPLEWEESAGKYLKLAVICTKSEDINHNTARREFCGPEKRIPQLVMEQLDKSIDDARKSGNKALKKELKRKQDLLFIEARNSHVKEGLQRAYASKVPGGKLEVFCISNTTYEKFSKKGNADMVRASGIPELRRFCRTITAGAQLLEAKNFLKASLPSLLNSIELWASSSPAHPQIEDSLLKESIDGVLDAVETIVTKAIDESTADFTTTFRDLLLKLLENRNDFWGRAARDKGLEWFPWHWTQYNAWCLNNGDHATQKRGHVNWNTELIWKMRTELAYQWDLLEDDIPIDFQRLLQSVKRPLLYLKSYLGEHDFVPTLVEGIDFRIRDIEYKFSLAEQSFARELKNIRRNASEPNGGSYILNEMIPAYRSASQEYGTGKAARQRSKVQGRITNGTLFPNISAAISTSVLELVRKTFQGLRDSVEAALSPIKSDIDMALASGPRHGGNDENRDNAEEERLREYLVEEIKELKKRHEALLAII